MDKKALGISSLFGLAIAQTSMAHAQSNDISQFTPSPTSTPFSQNNVSDAWRVTIDAPRTTLSMPETVLPTDRFEQNRVYSLSRDVPLDHGRNITIQFDAQRDDGNDFLDMIKSGGLPFSSGERVPGQGQWGLKFKKGVSVQYKLTW